MSSSSKMMKEKYMKYSTEELLGLYSSPEFSNLNAFEKLEKFHTVRLAIFQEGGRCFCFSTVEIVCTSELLADCSSPSAL